MTNTLTRAELPLEAIAELCRRYDVTELAVFGSYLTDRFGPESDIDFLAVFRDNDVGPWMSKLQDLEEALATLLGRRVDVVTRRGIEKSRNPYIRDAILKSAKVVYVS